jgi:hypothetical protein
LALGDSKSAHDSHALFLVGVQRSGTNMMAHGLDEAPEFEVYNEGNVKAFATSVSTDCRSLNHWWNEAEPTSFCSNLFVTLTVSLSCWITSTPRREPYGPIEM